MTGTVAQSLNVTAGLPLNDAIALLLVAVIIAAITKRYSMPYTVLLVIAGLGLGLLHVGGNLTLTHDTIFVLFLPPLIFQAAVEISWDDLRRNLWHVLGLAVIGVILNALMIAAVVRPITGLPFGVVLVLGTIVASTDPTAVVALFRDLRVTPRMTLLVEAESLINDAVSATLYLVVVASALGKPVAVGHTAANFAWEGLGGIAAGALLGWLMSVFTGHIDDLLIETALTLVLAYGSYLAADAIHVSGILAVLVAGLIVGNHGLPNRVHPEVRGSIQRFWQFTAFLANSLLFLLLGFQAVDYMGHFHWLRDLLITLVILICRALMVAAILSITGRWNEPVPKRWQVLLTWGGLRGAVSIALALGLPATLAHNRDILGIVYSTTLITLLVQGSTVRRLVRWLKIPMDQPEDSEPEPDTPLHLSQDGQG